MGLKDLLMTQISLFFLMWTKSVSSSRSVLGLVVIFSGVVGTIYAICLFTIYAFTAPPSGVLPAGLLQFTQLRKSFLVFRSFRLSHTSCTCPCVTPQCQSWSSSLQTGNWVGPASWWGISRRSRVVPLSWSSLTTEHDFFLYSTMLFTKACSRTCYSWMLQARLLSNKHRNWNKATLLTIACPGPNKPVFMAKLSEPPHAHLHCNQC